MKLILKEKGSSERERVPGTGIDRGFPDLMDHAEDILSAGGDRLGNIAKVYDELVRYGLKELPEDTEEFVRLAGKVRHQLSTKTRFRKRRYFQVLINSFNFTDHHNSRLGTVLYLGASILNHSCLPNASFSFRKGGEIVIR